MKYIGCVGIKDMLMNVSKWWCIFSFFIFIFVEYVFLVLIDFKIVI